MRAFGFDGHQHATHFGLRVPPGVYVAVVGRVLALHDASSLAAKKGSSLWIRSRGEKELDAYDDGVCEVVSTLDHRAREAKKQRE